MPLESLSQVRTDVERCRECRGHVVPAGDEYVCTSCGVVARKVEEEKYHLEFHMEAPSQLSDRHLGSYVGDRSDKDSKADFNGVSTLGFAKLLSDNMGVDGGDRNCKAMIRMAADKLVLPPFVRDNAAALSEKMLAESRASGIGRRTAIAAVSAYAILSASRAAGMDHIGSGTILRAFADMGHGVSKSALLRMGLDSKVPLRPADPKALLRTVMAGLESNEAVLKRLRKEGFEPGPYFRGLLQGSLAVLSAMDGVKDGRNPRAVAAGSVYIASRKMAPRAVMQREVAESVGVTEYTIREFCGWASKELGPLNAGPS